MNSFRGAAAGLAAYFNRPVSPVYQKIEQDNSEDPEPGLLHQDGTSTRTRRTRSRGLSLSHPARPGRCSLRGGLGLMGGLVLILFIAAAGHTFLSQRQQDYMSKTTSATPSATPSGVAAVGESGAGVDTAIATSSAEANATDTYLDPATDMDPNPNHRRLRIILPADAPGANLCKTILSLYANGYPAPVIVNWGRDFNKGGDRGFGKSHIGKVDGIYRSIVALSSEAAAPADERLADDDLLIVLDAYDVWMQLPPSVLVSRYFAHNAAADRRLAEEEWHGDAPGAVPAPKHDIVISSQKRCWPTEEDGHATKCGLLPESNARPDLYGPHTDDPRNLFLWRPRFINSGSVMGSVGAMKKFFRRAMEKVDAAEKEGREVFSDQGIMGEILGEQEAYRRKESSKNAKALMDEGHPRERQWGEGIKTRVVKRDEEKKVEESDKKEGAQDGGKEKTDDKEEQTNKEGEEKKKQGDGDKREDGKKTEGDDKAKQPPPPPPKPEPIYDESYEFGIGLDYLQTLFKPTVFEKEDGRYLVLNDKQNVEDESSKAHVSPPRINGVPADVSALPPPYELAGVESDGELRNRDEKKESKDGKAKSDEKSSDKDDATKPASTYDPKSAFDPALNWGDVPLYTDFFSEAIPVAVHHNAHRGGAKQQRLRDWWDKNWFFPYLREVVAQRAPPMPRDENGNVMMTPPAEAEAPATDARQLPEDDEDPWTAGLSLLAEHEGVEYYAPPADARKPRTRIFDQKTLTSDGMAEADWDELCAANAGDKWWEPVFMDGKGWRDIKGPDTQEVETSEKPDAPKEQEHNQDTEDDSKDGVGKDGKEEDGDKKADEDKKEKGDKSHDDDKAKDTPADEKPAEEGKADGSVRFSGDEKKIDVAAFQAKQGGDEALKVERGGS